ncbi:MAG: hypothetical protein M4579_001220 [Chaenotheca gracillima]|nr:MAG: hypothetical protein M4579_001220 [Chaenotheca gracillima]
MISRKTSRPLVLHVSTTSREDSPSASSLCSDWDADDEGTMSSSDHAPSRPMSLAIPTQIPTTAHCSRWPTLSEVLSNTAPPPWTLTAFMAYLSQNHCLETLEFTMDAGRYRSHYNEMAVLENGSSQGRDFVRMLWQRLLDAYITQNGPREVNLPSNVRDRILSLPNDFAPPPPEVLDTAVKIVYELMEESVLVPFLNSASRSVRDPTHAYAAPWRESPESTYGSHSLEERSVHSARSRRGSSPPTAMELVTSSLPANRRATRSSPGASNMSSTSGDNLTDDSGGASSPGHEPMTPPTTPPTSDAGGTSPRSRDNNGTWKKMTGKLGWKKRPGGGRYPTIDDEGHFP